MQSLLKTSTYKTNKKGPAELLVFFIYMACRQNECLEPQLGYTQPNFCSHAIPCSTLDKYSKYPYTKHNYYNWAEGLFFKPLLLGDTSMNLAQKTSDYFKGSISEMKKVVWPTRKQTIKYSSIVIAMSISMAVFFGILDYFFGMGLDFIVR
jgi:preprotein translocase subunit SecE